MEKQNAGNNKTVSFDDYVGTYQKEVQSSINFIGQDVDFFIELKANLIIDTARKYFGNPENLSVLDIGCGIGLTDHHLTGHFKNLHGVDIVEGVVNEAIKYNPSVKYSLYDGLRQPFEDSTMDIVFAINVMHHIEPSGWSSFVKEMYRVVKPGGIALVFEHNPLNPLTRVAVSRCEFDRDAVLIYKNRLKKIFTGTDFQICESKYIVFFPFRSKMFRSIETVVVKLPFGAQYYLAGRKKSR